MADRALLPAKSPRKRGPGRPFQKGTSGNPAGRPPLPSDFKARAVAYATDALDVLHAIAIDSGKPAAARVSAASAIIDRAHGKPTTTVFATIDTLGELIAQASKVDVPALLDRKNVESGS